MILEMSAKANCKGSANASFVLDKSAASPYYFENLQVEHQRLHVCPWISPTKVQA
jgi:hypothetical protein